MIKTILGFILLNTLLLACSAKDQITFQNPLDQIVGDKWINADSIRKNNYSDLIGIPKSFLFSESKLYKFQKLNETVFLMKQLKNYSDARHFNALIVIQNDTIKRYKIVEDFSVIDVKNDGSNWILLLSDWNNTSKHWPGKHQIVLKKLDSNLKEIWTKEYYSKIYPLDASSIEFSGSDYIFSLKVITNCHVCYSLVNLKLSQDGAFISIDEIEKINSEGINKDKLEHLFKTN